jgi:RimJ/RimL family protein N-acetyltransferase
VGHYVVRRFEKSDARALKAAVDVSLSHLLPWMPWASHEPQSLHQREELIQEWSHDWDGCKGFVMGIFVGDRVVGGTGLHLRGAEGTVEIGYWVHVDYLRQGIASQVVAALCTEAFRLWPAVDIVQILHDQANIASGAIPKKLGFHLIESLNRTPEAPSESGIHLRWAITREAFTAQAR